MAAAERRVLGLPKPNPPLERPCPPSSIRYFAGGVPGVWGVRGEGGGGGVRLDPEWSRRSTLDAMEDETRGGLSTIGSHGA